MIHHRDTEDTEKKTEKLSVTWGSGFAYCGFFGADYTDWLGGLCILRRMVLQSIFFEDAWPTF